MDIHLSEEEQVEALKKWWKENGISVAAGVVIGLGGVFGWQYWNKHQDDLAEQASYQFEILNASVAAGLGDSAVKQAEGLIANFQDSNYAVFAALEAAKLKLEQGDSTGARGQLQWAMDNTSDPSLKQISRLRLARVMLSEGDADAAAGVIAQASKDEFQGEIAELSGDIALAKGDMNGAREAYQQALDNQVGSSALVRIKLNDLSAVASDS
ncbi:MAG: tetratricopeptide repeat protein [Candidatus Sedimenticola sp. 6PFRAG7]